VAVRTTHKIPQELWHEVVEQSKIKTYRELAKEYDVSYESIRSVISVELTKSI
jgi:Mor family transcriptional regulator